MGKVDLLLGKDGKLELLDFKTQKRPDNSNFLLERCCKQMCIYAFILRRRYNIYPDRFYIYWTGESALDKALTEFSFRDYEIKTSIKHFDDIVSKIKNQEFGINRIPPPRVCMECDFRNCCEKEGVFNRESP